MKALVRSEWERLWRRKSVWLLFGLIPVMLIGAASFLTRENEKLSSISPQYTVLWNFPVMALSEMLFTAFQGVILVVVTLLVTQEYQERSIRLILMRSFSNLEIILAKYFTAFAVITLFFAAYFVGSYGVGTFFFSSPKELALFYHDGMASPYAGFLYSLKFYTLAWLTSIAVLSTLFSFACLSRTTTGAMGTGISFLFLSFAYPYLLSFFDKVIGNELFLKLFFTSIPMIQWQGITYMLAENSSMVMWNMGVLASYIVFFSCATLLVMKKNDFFY
ncbi:ABC transporter permease [Alkalihalobacillus oceani]|uniref:ABC transporter permease n=1 Tax=Halalkalibacter oceani TaxID=1653776 RepID=UPI0020405F2A|nr:ABC transporter permease [Halalkalibacter oceani]MCM3761416.1 ABC transporter permease [Halalkalibacter oceani]